MLINSRSRQALPAALHRGQEGVVLLIALIVLVAMTLGGIALVRSVDLTNIIAGNLAFRQAATHSADLGIETAVTWLEANNVGAFLHSDIPAQGYSANGNAVTRSPNPATPDSDTWEEFWPTLVAANRVRTLAEDAAGNTVAYVIDRMCSLPGNPVTGGAQCSGSAVVSSALGNAEEGGEVGVAAPIGVYYRITARVAGPRNTVSFVQAMVSL